MSQPPARPAVLMLCGAFAFALMGALTSGLQHRCDWMLVAFVRALFMFGSAVILARWARVPLVVWTPKTLWMRSLAGTLSLVCNFFALARLPTSEVLTLTNIYPIWILILSALMVGKRPGAMELLGVASAIAGVALIERPQPGSDALAAGIAIFASLASAVALIGLHKLKNVDTHAVVAHFSGVASVVVAIALAARGHVQMPSASDTSAWLMLLGVGASGTIGQVFLTKAFAAGPPTSVSVVGLSQVIFALGFDVAIWHRALTPAMLGGIALVLLPTAWLMRKADPLLEAPPEPDADL